MRYIFVLFILFLAGNYIFAFGKHEVNDVEIHIIDGETGMPLPNIPLYYMLKKVTGYIVDGTFSIIKSTFNKYNTDSNGIIRIPGRTFSLLKNQYIFSEIAYINIDLDSGDKSVSDKYYFLSRKFETNKGVEYIYPCPEYYSSCVLTFFGDGEQIILTQINNEIDEKNRIQRRSSFSDVKEKRIIIVKMVSQVAQVHSEIADNINAPRR